MDQPALVRADHRLQAIRSIELIQDSVDMELDRARADRQRRADLLIALALGQLLQNRQLPLGQLVAREAAGELGSYRRRNPGPATLHSPDRLQQRLKWGILEDVAHRPGDQSPVNVLV